MIFIDAFASGLEREAMDRFHTPGHRRGRNETAPDRHVGRRASGAGASELDPADQPR